ncbi:MAG: cytochrome c oxidase assembly protein, partial [Tomitella sp.]|nr:cytochrome c oxidase assembly protein [Tomitella sp.]
MSAEPGSPAVHAPGRPRRPIGVGRAVITLIVLCVAATAVATVWVGASPYDVVSTAYPGGGSAAFMAAVRTIAIISASITVGAAVFAVFFVGHSGDGLLGVRGYAATRLTARAAAVWATAAFVMIFATSADGAGMSIRAMLSRKAFFDLYAAVEQPKSWTVAFVAAVVVAAATRLSLRWMSVLATLGLSVPGSVAPGMVGNNGQGLGHDLATNVLILHSAAAAVWLGVLVAAWSCLRSTGPGGTADEVLRRVRWFTVGAIVLLGGTGAGMTWLQIRDHGFSSTYAALTLGQVAATVLLAVLALARARRAARGAAGARSLLPDIALVLAAIAAAAITAHIPSPSLLHTATTAHEIYIGYDVPGPWTWSGLVTHWRVDTLWMTIAIVMVAGYLLAVRSLRHSGRAWPAYRTALWTAGWLLVVLATSSGVNTWSSAQFSM